MPMELIKLKNIMEAAQSRFDNATSKHEIDAAIYELNAAELRLQAYIVSQRTA